MKSAATRLFVGAVLLVGLGLFNLSNLSSAADDAVSAKSLQGVWSGVRWLEGKGEDPEAGVKLQIIFKGEEIIGQRGPKALIGKGTFKVSADGKKLDAMGTTGGYKDKDYLGIIKIKGSTLYWCTTYAEGKDRPSEFVAGGGRALLILKKAE